MEPSRATDKGHKQVRGLLTFSMTSPVYKHVYVLQNTRLALVQLTLHGRALSDCSALRQTPDKHTE